jgi:hypothetical protein
MNRTLQFIIALFLSGIILPSSAQTSSIRGVILDAEAHYPLINATVQLRTVDGLIVASDMDGRFEFSDVPVGRHLLVASFMGYESRVLEGVVVTSGRPVILEVMMQESVIAIEAAEVTATQQGEVMNEMATVSARAFTIEETDRYAGSRGDPARMASNFAGVQGADDSRNDIVVRGNSPSGVLWRLEGVDIPNPNHFSIPGTGGGPVAILNNKVLANSDFFTAAFPAEFGNSTSAVFDLRMRNGSQSKPLRSIQFGFLGAELMFEGPLNREKRSSYLVNYRYSSASIFSALGIDIGTSAVPRYQDGSFRLFFPQSNGGALAVWGIGGASNIDILISDQTKPERNVYGDNDRDQYFGSGMGILGTTYTRPINEKTYVKATVAASRSQQTSEHDLVYRQLTSDGLFQNDSIVDYMGYQFTNDRVSAAIHVNRKLSRNASLRFGLNVDGMFWNFQDSVRVAMDSSDALGLWNKRWDAKLQNALIQPFVQWKYRPNEKITMTAGWHAAYHSLSGDLSMFEPRLGFQYKANDRTVYSAGAGFHSQSQASYLYASTTGADLNGNLIMPNQKMKMTRSLHAVLGMSRQLNDAWSLKMEAYYQELSNVPVEIQSSSFSLINSGAGFNRFFPDSLVNNGTGRNFGIEATVARAFRDGWFMMLTGSVFDSKYKGSDNTLRNTDFNGKYAWNALASRDWKFNNQWHLVTGLKFTMTGGRWYGFEDSEASAEAREVVFFDEGFNSRQFDPYMRLDFKTNLRWNRPESTHELGIDFVNVTGRQNVLKLTYSPDDSNNAEDDIREEYQLGFLPIFFYRVDF